MTRRRIIAEAANIERALDALRGSAWKDVRSELHLQYREFPIRVLLHDDGCPDAAHEKLVEIVTPFMTAFPDFEVLARYAKIIDGAEYVTARVEGHGSGMDAFGSGLIWSCEPDDMAD
jgi:hypothetical protein